MASKKESKNCIIYPPKDSDSHMIKRSTYEQSKIKTAKKISIKEASAYSFMDGFGLRYITPYALAVGASNTQVGLLSSLPSLLGNLSQLFTLEAMKRWSRKKIVFSAVFLQAVMWLVLILAGTFYFVFDLKEITPDLVVIVYTLLILFGAFGGPAWTSWMKDLVTVDSGKYFGRRSRIATTISLICMFIGGFLLDYFKQTKIFIGFIILFFIAFVGRSFSAYFIRKQYEPRFEHDEKYYFTFMQFIKRSYTNNFGKFAIYYALISFAVNITSPFLAVYMLKDLNFSYSYFMAVSLASVVTTLLFVGLWGKFSDKYGNLKTMNITGLLIPFLPLLWLCSMFFKTTTSVFIYLLIVECLSGLIWAGFNLAAGNFIYDAVSRQRIAICTCYFNIISGVGVLIGATLGGIISSHSFTFFGLSPILFVFLLGGIARILIYLAMNSKIKEVRAVKPFVLKDHIGDMTSKIKTRETNYKAKIGQSTKKFFESVDSYLEK
jgi:MFS family permease